MDCLLCLYYLILAHIISVSTTTNSTDFNSVRVLDAQQDERIRLECSVTSKFDAEEAMWMRIRSPHNPDILTYRDSVVYAPDRIQLDQRRLSSSINVNGTFVDTYFLTLTILRPTIEDEGRYICAKGKNIFAEYDLFIIVPPQFVDDNGFIHQQTVIEGSTLQLSCSVNGRPKPSITWFSRTSDGKHLSLNEGKACQDSVCELRLGNYSRNDPAIIECVADNEKSTRISKIFHVDVYYPPKLLTNIRTIAGSRLIDVVLQCSVIANPPATIVWLNENKQEIADLHLYKIQTTNQSSSLAFSISTRGHSSPIFHCRASNSLGIDEKLINIADFIQFDPMVIQQSTTTHQPFSPTTIDSDVSLSRKHKPSRPGRARSRTSTTTATSLTSTLQVSSSSNSFFFFSSSSSFILLLLLVIDFSMK